MDQIEIQTIIWHVSPYWLDTWHNTYVTRGMNNFQKKNSKNSKKYGTDMWHIFNTVNSILTEWA